MDASARRLGAGQIGLLSGWGVFSTFRVYDGVVFQWARHWQRMKRDAERMHVPFPSEPRWLEEGIYRLIEANHAQNATLRISVVRNRGGLFEGSGQTREFDILAFTADVARWPSAVKLGVLANGRHAASEFAGTKYLSWAENLTRYERAHQQGLDEVILLNERHEVSECTSANVFAVQGKEVSTPPLSAGCLPGVTRALLLEEIRVPGIEIVEKKLTLDDLSSAHEVFITSSTRELLPASHIFSLRADGAPGDVLRQQGDREVCSLLQEAFTQYVRSYVAERQKPVYS